jgi:FMN phosphatase YigB (HAD superfamily)
MKVAIVHYHLDSGGVTRVIEATSACLSEAGIAHVILSASPALTSAQRMIPALGYFQNSPTTAAELLSSLRKNAAEALAGPPDLWHFHNHSLGKNCLLPAVIALLAAAGDRLVLQIHDLAENGRPQNFPLIAAQPSLYPFGPRIHYAFINRRDRDLFAAAGLPQSHSCLLANPITAPLSPAHKVPTTTLVFASIRGIRRKNLGELILLAALAPPGCHFAISRAPQNPDALPIHDTWRKFVQKHRFRIEFDVVDRFSPAAGAAADFKAWIAHASHFVSTSIEEGFGLPLLEAVALSKPLIGRNLPHLTAEHTLHGIHHTGLYNRILIPLAWVDLTLLKDQLQTTLERNFRFYQRPLSPQHLAAVLDSLIDADQRIDFGNLPEPLQQSVLERVTEKANREVPLVEIDGQLQPLEAWLATVLGRAAPADSPDLAALAPYSLGNYATKLIPIYQNLTDQAATAIAHLPPAAILDAHLTPQRFHFLLSAPPPPPSPVKFRAVIFDIYGTLLIAPPGAVKPDPWLDPVLRQIFRDADLTPPASPSTALHQAVLRHHAASAAEFPEIDLRVLWREVLSLPDDFEISPLIATLEAAWHPTQPMPGAAAAIQRLSRSGLSLGLLSNAQCHTLDSLGSLSQLFAPELSILSFQHGIAKPAAELFTILSERLAGRKISPAETLYIGNDPLQDIAPAAAAGFRTALFVGHPSALRPGDCTPDFTLQRWQDLPGIFGS